MRTLKSPPIWAEISFVYILLAAGIPAQNLPPEGVTPLKIEDVVVSDLEGGPQVSGAHTFGAGEKVYLSFKIGGFKIGNEPRNVSLEFRISALDDLGALLAPPATGKVDVEIEPEDKHWRPRGQYELEIPPFPRPGAHKLVVAVTDKLANKAVQQDVPLRVRSAFPNPPPEFSVYDLHFFGAEDAEKPLPEGEALRTGGRLYARFYLTGYKFARGNAYKVEYGVSLQDASGKVLLDVPAVAAESGENFYPKSFVPCSVAIDLPTGAPSGEYMLIISGTDLIGEAQLHSEHRFRMN